MNWLKRLIEEFIYKRDLKKKLKKASKQDPYIYK